MVGFGKAIFLRYLKTNGYIVIFLVASWLGFSRAEYLASVCHSVFMPSGKVMSEMSPILFQADATVFVTGEKQLFRVSQASHKMACETSKD